MKSIIKIQLSTKSINEATKILQEYEKNIRQGIKNSIKAATEAMYDKVVAYCYLNGIGNHVEDIHWEYDENTNTGRVWTKNDVIIFNEMGTGVKGNDNPHPSPNGAFKSWKYDVNLHGEKGWWYPTTTADPNPIKWTDKNGTLRAWTKGLPSRHMFYSAFEDIKEGLGDYVEVELRKTVGNIY